MLNLSDYDDNVSHIIEVLGVYDGWSILVTKDGQYLNRWRSDDDPTVAEPGYERRFNKVEDYLNEHIRPGEADPWTG